MCCSVSPGVRVEFTDTVLYAAEVVDANAQTVHVLGYQNRARNGAGVTSPRAILGGALRLARTGNAMILPFPALAGTMTEANVIDTSRCRDALQDMARAVAPPPRGAMLRARSARSVPAEGVPAIQVFRAAGIYTVVLARDPRDIPGALDRVPRSRRPALNPALFEAYATWYPGWTVALCCFNNRRAKLAHPLVWWYRPRDPERLFLPALDGHTGEVPDLEHEVEVDHVVAVGSATLVERAREARERRSPLPARSVAYRDAIPTHVAPYVLPYLVGGRFDRPMPNGDFVCDLDDVHEGRFLPRRERPGATLEPVAI